MVTAHVSAETAARVALLIGNAAYADAPLRNPINDVREVGQMLRAIGFKVTTRENLRRDEMRDALRGFLLTHRSADVRLVYYAGHGLQMRGRSYLLPVGAAVHSERDVLERTVDATELVEQLGEIKHGANLVVIDACRVAAMFEAQTRDLWAARPGLARVPAPRGTVVAFSTRPGHVARDGDQAMSIYARHFTRTLEKVPELPVEAFFKRVRAGVVAETRNRQVPWESSDLNGELCFRPNAEGRCRRSPPG
jgi:carboxyl-terminal processing protease